MSIAARDFRELRLDGMSRNFGSVNALREKKKAGLLGRKPKPAPELEEEEVGAEA